LAPSKKSGLKFIHSNEAHANHACFRMSQNRYPTDSRLE
jgi:hypothetical protein